MNVYKAKKGRAQRVFIEMTLAEARQLRTDLGSAQDPKPRYRDLKESLVMVIDSPAVFRIQVQ